MQADTKSPGKVSGEKSIELTQVQKHKFPYRLFARECLFSTARITIREHTIHVTSRATLITPAFSPARLIRIGVGPGT